jgi:hypothetical protein
MKAFPNAFWWQTEQAALHYRAGRFDQALPLLERSLKGDLKRGAAASGSASPARSARDRGG